MHQLAYVVQVAALVILTALLVAAGAAKLARLDGATYPSAIMRAAAVFAAVVTLAATITAVIAQLVS
ncbi:hypothetical protein ADK57_05370 [Streptomyces sp. MMG1533]|uniref:hypothetical protein n=1 Tax=Streptomyces sp. MMG1533 TaxID=1415546 RepID=UPI0006ADCD9C|nr:hypothetical protein [Streptomyces sp. MMG1533]KOU76202.1 hypothetical protein ADK57_05370 [Streptomyces sp. MMG1533]